MDLIKQLEKMNLDESKLKVVQKLISEAEKQNVNPELVLPLVMAESGFNSSAKSKKGAVGVMQLMPETAKGLGVDPYNEDENIAGGIKLIKQLTELKHIGQDPYKLLVGYNNSPTSIYFKTGNPDDLPQETQDYLVKVHSLYGGELPSPLNNSEKTQATENTQEEDSSSGRQYGDDTVKLPLSDGKESKGMSAKQEAGIIGATTGALAGATTGTITSAYNLIKDFIPKGANLSPDQIEKLVQVAIQNQGSQAAGAAGEQAGISAAGRDAGRLASGETGSMPYNYAKAAGLTDIEAAQALDMTKQEGGVHDLTSKRREGTTKVQKTFPGERYVENPNFGGLLTLDQGGGKGPKQSFKVQGALPTADLPPDYMPGPAAPPPEGTLVQLPKAERIPITPISPAAPQLTPKQKIMAEINNRMASIREAANEIPNTFSRVAPVVGRTVMGGLAGFGAGYNAQDAYEKFIKGDTIGGTTGALASAASAASMIPKVARFAGPPAVALTTANQIRDEIKSGNYQNAAESGLTGLMALFPRLFGPAGAALYSRGLNEGEDEELARRRAMPVTLSR